MRTYTLTLTDAELACGVTLEQVADIMPKVLLFHDHKVMLPKDIGPALAGAVARCVYAGAAVEFSHLSNGYPVYGKENA